MQLKLFLLLPRQRAESLVREGFDDSAASYRLSLEEYTACSAFSRQALVELQLELSSEEERQYRRELEMPSWDDEGFEGEETAAGENDSIYWYEFPSRVLQRICKKRVLVEKNRKDCGG